MSYKVLDEVVLNNDRLCIYFKFDPLTGISYAAKQSVSGEISHTKTETLIKTIEWLGFGDLTLALFNSPKFLNRFKPVYTPIIKGELAVLNLQSEYHYLVNENGIWTAYESVNDCPFTQNEQTQRTINSVMGRNFVENLEKELEVKTNISKNFSEGISQMRKFNSDIAEGKFNKSETNRSLAVVDINDATCSVA